MTKFPNSLTQSNTSKFDGSMFSSFNIDLSEKGTIKTMRSKMLFGESISSNYDGLAVSIQYFDYATAGEPVYCVYNGNFWYGENKPGSTWSQVTGTNVPGTSSEEFCDMKVFNKKMYATEPTTLHSVSPGGSWSLVPSGSLVNGAIHILQPYAKRMYYVYDKLKIRSFDTSESVATSGNYTLDLTGFEDVGHISWMESASNKIWVGVTSNSGGRATVFEWDGVLANTPTRQYKLNSPGTMVCAIVNDSPVVVDSKGIVYGFTGSGFKEISRFPVANYDGYFDYGLRQDGRKNIHFNGKLVEQDRVFFLVRGTYVRPGTGNEFVYEMPSGVWCLDLSDRENSGLYHYCASSLSTYNESTTAVSVVDYGEYKSSFGGALASGFLIEDTTGGGISSSNLIWGAMVLSSPNNHFLFGTDSGLNLPRTSSFTSPFIKAGQVTDTFQAINTTFEKLGDSEDTITLKYRTQDREPISNYICTITSQTTVTIASDITANVSLGDEITFLDRTCAGHVAHVSNITTGGGSSTVTIDEPLLVSSGTSSLMFTNFKKIIGRVNSVTNFSEFQVPNNNKDVKFQFKVVIKVKDQSKIYSLSVSNNGDKLIKE